MIVSVRCPCCQAVLCLLRSLTRSARTQLSCTATTSSCRGYDLQACLKKDTPRPQDEWHESYGTATAERHIASSVTSVQPSRQSSPVTSQTGAEAECISGTSRADAMPSALAATFTQWLYEVAEQKIVYCSGKHLQGLEEYIMNSGVWLHLPLRAQVRKSSSTSSAM
jgi:hypothetical protein